MFSILIGGFLVFAYANTTHVQTPFKNLIVNPEDKHEMASIAYMLHRAWVQFALAWLGHDTMLVRMDQQ